MIQRRDHTFLAFAVLLLLSFAAMMSSPSAAADHPFGSPAANQQAAIQADGQTPDQNAAPAAPGIAQKLLAKARMLQQQFYRDLPASIRVTGDKGGFDAGWALIALSFAYGVFHAVGPGHGKVVVSGYLLANEQSLRRGIALAFASSLLQALTAIAAVGIIVLAFGLTARTATAAVPWLERISFVALIALGFWLLWRAFKTISTAETAPHSHDAHDHQDGHAHHHHEHDENCGHDCGHAHMLSAQEIAGKNWKELAAMALAVGIRPCSGALLVLVFSYTIGVFWIGAISAFAMSVGTALTVSALALLTVGSKRIALWLSATGSGKLARALETLLRFAGGLLLIVSGTLLLVVSLGSPAPPF